MQIMEVESIYWDSAFSPGVKYSPCNSNTSQHLSILSGI